MKRVTRASIGEGCRRDWIAGGRKMCDDVGDELLAAWRRVGEYENIAVEGREGCGLTSSKDPAIDLWIRVEGVRWKNAESGEGMQEEKKNAAYLVSGADEAVNVD